MVLKGSFEKKTFVFKRPSGTSRGILTEKHAWFLQLWHVDAPINKGIGECSIIPGLSPDFESFENYEAKLKEVCENPEISLEDWPSIKFAVESAKLDLKNGCQRLYFDNSFSRRASSMDINGLIWMGDEAFMNSQIEEKLKSGFTTIKMKIGAIDFNTEFQLLSSIRSRYQKDEITLRVDANGAFNPSQANDILKELATLDIHSIEQPIRKGKWQEMNKLCKSSPVPIALDEELIGVNKKEDKIELLDTIQPQYIILKPSLHGGISGTQEWIALAEERLIPWWMTSALESNIGLEVICQLAGNYNNKLPQGLGTGSLYTTNIDSDLCVENGKIFYRK